MIHSVSIKSTKQLEKIRYASRVLADLLQSLTKIIQPGISVQDVDHYVEQFILDHGGRPAFKGYNGFPNAACCSVNDCVIHGIPSNRILKKRDIIGVDVGMDYEGGYSDTCYTYAVGDISKENQTLMKVTEQSLYVGIEQALDGNRVGDIGFAIQEYIKPYGYGIVREYCGHGVGNTIWEPPEIPNYGKPGRGARLRKGMVIAIEPMINQGTHRVFIEDDGWSVITADHQNSAHYEHTVLITSNEPEILTLWKTECTN
jgi:methionyl aminopeptidase